VPAQLPAPQHLGDAPAPPSPPATPIRPTGGPASFTDSLAQVAAAPHPCSVNTALSSAPSPGAFLQAAGLVEELSQPDAPLTVFAPTNDAFATALGRLSLTAEQLLGNNQLLTDVSGWADCGWAGGQVSGRVGWRRLGLPLPGHSRCRFPTQQPLPDAVLRMCRC